MAAKATLLSEEKTKALAAALWGENAVMGTASGIARVGVSAVLLLIAVLARRGVVASLVVGRPRNGFGAHAWVEVDGLPALPVARDKFAQLAAL